MGIMAFSISGVDNDSYMFIDGHPDRCKDCGAKLSNQFNPDLKLKGKNFDICSTYDHYTIISSRLLEYLKSLDIRFNYFPLNRYSEHFILDDFSFPIHKIEDYNGLKYSKKCKICGFKPTYGSIYLKEPIHKGIYRSDLLFSVPGKESPILIVGLETVKNMKPQKFKGLSFVPIKSENDYVPKPLPKKNNKKVKVLTTKTENIKYGKPKPLDDVYLKDFLKYPIWTWALEHEGEDGMDETWVYPIVNTSDVTDDMIDVFIILKDHEGNYFMANYYTDEEVIDAIYMYEDDDFVELRQVENLQYPFSLFAIPTINQVKKVEFIVKEPDSKCNRSV